MKKRWKKDGKVSERGEEKEGRGKVNSEPCDKCHEDERNN